MRSISALSVGALAALLLTACGGDSSAGFATLEPQEGYHDAALSATLIESDDCLLLQTHEGQRYLPLFPTGSTLEEDRLRVGESAYTVGSTHSFGGSQSQQDPAELPGVSIPDACDQSVDAAWVVSPG